MNDAMVATVSAAVIVGVLGSLHCVGMCGGIVSAFSLGTRDTKRSPWMYRMAYHAGRLLSYGIAGALVGALGASIAINTGDAMAIARVISALFLIALGFYLAGFWNGLTALESIGNVVWRRLQPLGRYFLPMDHPAKAFALGTLWGWLPCGMVYVALSGAVVAADPVMGSAAMLAFGIGTLPALLAVGAGADRLRVFARAPWLRRGAGVALFVLGIAVLLGSGSVGPPISHVHGA